MEKDTNKTEYTIDATGKRLGRIATEAAALLLGKNSASYTRNQAIDVNVKLTNVSKLDITEKKRKNEEFQNYSGYPGGRHVEKLGHLAERRGYSEVVKRVVSGMLPKNKLHKPRMKNLEITE